MPKLRETIVREAAFYYVRGDTTATMLKHLGVQYKTLKRIEAHPAFSKEVERLIRQRSCATRNRLRELTDDCLKDMATALWRDRDNLRFNRDNAKLAVEMIKTMESQSLARFFAPDEPGQFGAGSGQNGAEKGTKGRKKPQPGAKRAGITPISSESFPGPNAHPDAVPPAPPG